MGKNRIAIAVKILSEHDRADMTVSALKKTLVLGGVSTSDKVLEDTLRHLNDLGLIKEIQQGLFRITIRQ